MAEGSTSHDDTVRFHVSGDTLSSLNLKMENNLNEYIVLSVDIDGQCDLLKTLSMIINEDRIVMIDDIDSSLSYIHSLPNTMIFLIISGTLGQIYIEQFVNNPQIISIYVFCRNTHKHRLWAKEVKKIRFIVSNMEELIIRLYRDIKQLSSRWPFEEKSFQKALTSISEWYSLFLLVICHHPKSFEKSYYKMFNECRTYYAENARVLERIDQLAQTYRAEDAIREYTRDGFLYRIINHALRTQNMETIRKFSPYITDLHYALHEHYRKYYRSNTQSIRFVYRGQYLSFDELQYIRSVCKSRNPIIKLTTFTSSSRNPEVALQFALSSPGRIPCLFEIIITDEYDDKHRSWACFQQVFADISLLSFMPTEQEVLFSLVTHFRVKYVGDSTTQSHRPWVPIVLELVISKGKINSAYFNIVNRIESITDTQMHSDILDILQLNVSDEKKFNKINWQKCWNKFINLWATDIPHEQPLLLTIYDCFTEDKYYLRKAIEMHKDIIRSKFDRLLDSSSFFDLLKQLKRDQFIPTKGIALYELYLKKFCSTNTTKVIECLQLVGDLYCLVYDNEHALESYQLILHIDVHNQHKRNDEVKKRIKQLNKTNKPNSNQRIVIVKKDKRDFQRIYPVQEEEWACFWTLEHRKDIKLPPDSLGRLAEYLITRKAWYYNSDLNVILRLPIKATEDTSIEFYRYYSFLAIQTHIQSNVLTTDSTNNYSLSLWRYEKYMNEWILFQNLYTFLKRFQHKSNLIQFEIFPRLEQLINLLNLLIIVCTTYICINQKNGKVNVDNIPFINVTDTNIKQLAFFDLNSKDLLAELEALQETIQTSLPTVILSPDEEEFFAPFI